MLAKRLRSAIIALSGTKSSIRPMPAISGVSRNCMASVINNASPPAAKCAGPAFTEKSIPRTTSAKKIDTHPQIANRYRFTSPASCRITCRTVPCPHCLIIFASGASGEASVVSAIRRFVDAETEIIMFAASHIPRMLHNRRRVCMIVKTSSILHLRRNL